MNQFKEIIQDNRTWYCLDCGKCSSVCPITTHLVEGYTSPRLLVETTLTSGEDSALEDPLLWSCLTCRRCTEICPAGVDFSTFIRELRGLAFNQGLSGSCTHSGVIQSWMQIMMDPELEQDRLRWIKDDLQVSIDSDTIYFPGCLPYYDTTFEKLGIEGLDIARAAVRILNAVGIEPQIMENERCCGHDLYWEGDKEGFIQLAELNLEAISRTGASQLVTTCPECAYTLRETYREEVRDIGLDVFHLSEFLTLQEKLPLDFKSGPMYKDVTYQDPCRLGRYSGGYQQPRTLLDALGCSLVEMEHNRQQSICCGTSCWTSCGQVNKQVQLDRLQEARATGAEVLVTACPKCQIHLKCAQKDSIQGEEIQIPIRDITTLMAERI